MISFECSKCGKKFTVPDEQAGRKGKCPQCQAIIIIPDASSPPTLRTAAVVPRDLLGDAPDAASDEADRSARPRAKAATPVKQIQPALAKPPAVSQARSGGEADGTSRLWVFGACGVAALFVVGLLVYVFVLRDTWEKDNRERIQGLSQEVISFARQDNESAMVLKQRELKAFLGSRTLKNPELKTAVSDADAAVAEAKGRVAAAKQAAERKRREDEEKAALLAKEQEAAARAKAEAAAKQAERLRMAKESQQSEEDKPIRDVLLKAARSQIAYREAKRICDEQHALTQEAGRIAQGRGDDSSIRRFEVERDKFNQTTADAQQKNSDLQANLREYLQILDKYPQRIAPVLKTILTDQTLDVQLRNAVRDMAQ